MKKLFSVLIIGLLMVSAFAFANGDPYTMLISQMEDDIVFVENDGTDLTLTFYLDDYDPEGYEDFAWFLREIQVQGFEEPLSQDPKDSKGPNRNKANKHGSPRPGKFDFKDEGTFTFNFNNEGLTDPFSVDVFNDNIVEFIIPLDTFEDYPDLDSLAVHIDLIGFDPSDTVDDAVYDSMHFMEEGGWLMHTGEDMTTEFDENNWAVYTVFPDAPPAP